MLPGLHIHHYSPLTDHLVEYLNKNPESRASANANRMPQLHKQSKASLLFSDSGTISRQNALKVLTGCSGLRDSFTYQN
ncbi:MAG: hypothetical protein QOH96_2703 [Blastocatellia bacterium]|nr:hypothetical protein [Blastocatellia bacterium]